MKFCERPFTHVYLSTDGEVWPCSWMHYVIGNLYEQDLGQIWHSEAAQKARESILDGSFSYCRKRSCPFCERDDLPDLTEEEILKRAIPSSTPLIINIANDYICNIACTTCRTKIYCPTEGEREKIDSALRRLLPLANKAQSVWMNGRGEFLANPSFIHFLKKLRPERNDFNISFETNGILFDEAHWSQFSHLGNYDIKVTVTLNSLRPDVYQYLSGGFDCLEQTLDHLQFLSKLRRENKINVLHLAMVVQESNFWEIPEYVQTFTNENRFFVDEITFRPVYNWFHMDRETYWFKNILNPLHPYHKAYLKILEDDCWKNPKVYDWGCHNIREPRLHPLNDEKTYSRLLLDIYHNKDGLSPVEYMRKCAERAGIQRIGVYGENDYSETFLHLLQKAGIEVTFKLTRFTDAEGEPPTISMPNFQPNSVNAILLMEFFDQKNRTNNLRSLKFEGSILNLADLIEGKESQK